MNTVYLNNHTVCLNIQILLKTAFKSDETRHVTQNVFFTSPKKIKK